MRHTFDELLNLAAAESGGEDVPTRASVVKELLHYDVLRALSDSEIGKHVVFQGGTALRLCYGGNRYSEDLDFVVGSNVSEPFLLESMNEILAKQVKERYGLDVKVVEPRDDQSFDREGVVVKRWRYAIAVPGFAAAQKINIEFCNVPAYEASPILLQPRYSFLSDAHGGIVLNTESENEIMADKILALAARPYLKARDVWDLRWLSQRGNQPDQELIERKAKDYGTADLVQKLETAAERLRSPGVDRAFMTEMQRFVSPSMVTALLNETPPGKGHLEHASRLVQSVRNDLAHRPAQSI